MKRKCRNHKPDFKAKVILAAVNGDLILAELAETMGNNFFAIGLTRIHALKAMDGRSGAYGAIDPAVSAVIDQSFDARCTASRIQPQTKI